MLNGQFVINATTHPYNLGPDNTSAETSSWRRTKGLYLHHKMLSPEDEHILTEDEMFSDFDYEGLAHALFAESACDYAIVHSLPNLGFNKRDIVEAERVARLRDTYPNRFLLYGNVTPLEAEHAIRRLEYQAENLAIGGLKLYPAAKHGNRLVGWRMDDREITFPIFERLQELGINNVAVHKASTIGAIGLSPLEVSDVEGAAAAFPDINFQVVHAGWAYLEKTILLMERYPNIYANLELTFSMIVNQPRMFAEILGRMLFWHLEDQIIFSDGANVVHPQPGLARFADFQMPEDLQEGMGFPALTPEIKHKILAGNIARIHGLDLDELAAGIADDRFARAAAEGYRAPWSLLRERMAAGLGNEIGDGKEVTR